MTNPNISGITLIPNQAFIFTPDDPNCKIDETQYCQLIASGDFIQIQEILNFDSECFDNLLCEEFAGVELVVNGVFYGSTGWLEAGNNWTIGSGQACYTAADGAGVLYQTIGGLAEGSTYRLIFTITEYVSGTLRPVLWSTDGSDVSADGTYTQYITIGVGHLNEFLNFVDTGWEGCISNISLIEIKCWDVENAPNWETSLTGICHTPGATDPIETFATIPANATGDCLYRVKVTVEGMTDGSITIDLNGSEFTTISANGEHEVYTPSFSGAPLVITPTSDFDGCITAIELKEMCDYPQLAIFDLDDNLICYISEDGGCVTDFIDNNIIWSFKLNVMECTIPYGCYRFKIFDPCEDCFVTDNILTNSNFDTDLAGWTTGGANFVWDTGNARATNAAFISQDLGLPERNICVKFTVVSISGTGSPNIAATIRNQALVTQASEVVFTAGAYSLSGTGSVVYFSALTGGTIDVRIDDIYVIESDSGCAKYCFQLVSNCLNYREEHDCTKYLKGSCDENSLGFKFNDAVNNNTGFHIRERVRTVTMNPSHAKKRNVALDSSGSKKLVYSESEKIWIVRFDYCDHLTHDALSTILECDTIEMNLGEVTGNPSNYDLVKNYVSLQEDYVPEWDSKGQRNLAQSQVELREVNATIFNQNLG